jgi:hypothetical protein
MKIPSFGLIVTLVASLLTHAQQTSPSTKEEGGGKAKNGNCGLLYGKGHSLTFCAPDGWMLDNGIMNDEGIYAVFYPVGLNWKEAKDSGTIMYINVVAKEPDTTVEKMMEADTNEVKHNTPSTVVKKGEPIANGNLSAQTLQFAPGAFDRYEAVAYLSEEKVLVMFVVSSKNESIFKKDYPAFVRLVQSYKFLSSNVTIQQK